MALIVSVCKRSRRISNVVYCDSPFEEQVAEFLENQGYEIECQYGAGRFRLDIVVKERGLNLLAIECDGAAYHSSLVARTAIARAIDCSKACVEVSSCLEH